MSLLIGENPKVELKMLLLKLGTKGFFLALTEALDELPNHKEGVWYSTREQTEESVRMSATQAYEDMKDSARMNTREVQD